MGSEVIVETTFEMLVIHTGKQQNCFSFQLNCYFIVLVIGFCFSSIVLKSKEKIILMLMMDLMPKNTFALGSELNHCFN
jgi:hypothetical protein